ncbi:acetoin utilization AcuB family protein [Oceanobacillus sp. J11TS1]|uniref:acetoin utilization AcuB family protein n=1 Tax=Oceanobacillus sp. J11TS1 TaxID=2807191 RepID=UPI001B06765A|nr:acetoin utilization AcuB family protein [Oceanobacillus sp. J11TS1]GIO24445.1 acetoin utilization protein AcuB [Oceanobacillus sp. J11TS1]
MLVEELMNRNMITLPPNATIREALQLLEKYKIRHITIVDEEMQVLGIVSDRDVRDASPSIFLDASDFSILNKEISTIMSSPVITIHPMDFVEEIAYIFYDKEIACLPVVSQNRLVGVVTEKDMLYKLIQLTGTHEQSSLIEVKVPDQPGQLPRVASVFGNHNVNIVSVLLYPYKDPEYKVLVFRVKTLNPMPIINDLREAGYALLWPNNIMEPKK